MKRNYQNVLFYLLLIFARPTSTNMPHHQQSPPPGLSLADQLIQLGSPPTYSGLDPRTVDIFFFSFNNMISQFGWMDEKVKSALSSFFVGFGLLLCYFLFSQFCNKTYQDIKKRFIGVFRDMACPYRVDDVIQSRMQGIGEPTFAYIMS